ncbi:uncharacterized protein LOC119600438 [Lucilia sericata]|uniref:uncharacterized protein LOC119600438 n=1 Tax=Lucilia sericata TaxID=13632 RepID=UPI0018A86AD0|nr:uncharacterized protein LOC119600438 [Lucilia sericata]
MFQSQQYETLILIENETQPRQFLYSQFYESNNNKSSLDLIPKLLLTQDNIDILETSWNINSQLLIILSLPLPYSTQNVDILEKFLQIHPKTLNIKIQHPLLTYPDQLQPRTILLYDKKGQIKMLGYIGRLITCYAQKINASIKIPFPIKINNPIFFTDVMEMTLNGSLDIPASIVNPNEAKAMKYYSRYVELSKWFPMLPVADYLTPWEIYYTLILQDFGAIFITMFVIYTLLLLIIELLRNLTASYTSVLLKSIINQQVFLGLLGSSFQIVNRRKYYTSYKFFILLIQFTGFMLAIFSNTYLTSNITTPPKHQEINSWDYLQKLNLKILMLQQGYDLLDLNVPEFVKLRNSLNKSVAYGVTSSQWLIYEKQQMYFSEKLFRYSNNMYFTNFMIYVLPLPANSIFEKSLNHFIANLVSAGILQYWYRSSFFDMIETGRMSFRDMSCARGYKPAT